MGSEDALPTGLKEGCMKWYKYRDNNDGTVNMILAHNTTAKISFSSTAIDNTQIITEIKEKVNRDTSTWQVKARPITANEIAGITGVTTFDEMKTTVETIFYFGSKTASSLNSQILNAPYSWLFDYTYDCTKYGCDIADSSNFGYWTGSLTVGGTSSTWTVNHDGILGHGSAISTNFGGLRPVVTVLQEVVSN